MHSEIRIVTDNNIVWFLGIVVMMMVLLIGSCLLFCYDRGGDDVDIRHLIFILHLASCVFLMGLRLLDTHVTYLRSLLTLAARSLQLAG